MIPDARTLIDHARVECQNHRFTYNEPLKLESLTQSICDVLISFGEGGDDRKVKMVCVCVYLFEAFSNLWLLESSFWCIFASRWLGRQWPTAVSPTGILSSKSHNASKQVAYRPVRYSNTIRSTCNWQWFRRCSGNVARAVQQGLERASTAIKSYLLTVFVPH